MCNLCWRGNRRRISLHWRNLNTVTESGHAPNTATRTSLPPFIYILSHSVYVTDETQNCIKSIFILKMKYIARSQRRHKEEATRSQGLYIPDTFFAILCISSVLFQIYSHFRHTLRNTNPAPKIFHVPHRKWCNRLAAVIIPNIVTSLYLSLYSLFLPSLYYNYSRQISVTIQGFPTTSFVIIPFDINIWHTHNQTPIQHHLHVAIMTACGQKFRIIQQAELRHSRYIATACGGHSVELYRGFTVAESR
jgi:hypothetical protein